MREAVLIALGLLGIYLEFLRPGWAIPGATGLVLIIWSGVEMMRRGVDWPAVARIDGPVFLLAPVLLAIAWRARRNKRRVN